MSLVSWLRPLGTLSYHFGMSEFKAWLSLILTFTNMHPGKEWVIAQGSSFKCHPRVTHLEFLAPGFTLPNSSHCGHQGNGRPVSTLEIKKIIYIHFPVLSNYFICYSHYTNSLILWISLNLNPTLFQSISSTSINPPILAHDKSLSLSGTWALLYKNSTTMQSGITTNFHTASSEFSVCSNLTMLCPVEGLSPVLNVALKILSVLLFGFT